MRSGFHSILLVLFFPVAVLLIAPNHSSAAAVLQERQQEEESEKESDPGKRAAEEKPVEKQLTWQEKIAANAELVVKTFKEEMDTELTFDRAGIEKIDGFINRNRQSWIDSGTSDAIACNLGSLVGECFVRELGARWVEDETGGFGVKLEGDVTAFPFNKVRKHVMEGDGDSVLGLYGAVTAMIKAKAADKDQ